MKAVSLFIVLYQSMSKKMFGACQSMHPGGVHTVYANETLKKSQLKVDMRVLIISL